MHACHHFRHEFLDNVRQSHTSPRCVSEHAIANILAVATCESTLLGAIERDVVSTTIACALHDRRHVCLAETLPKIQEAKRRHVLVPVAEGDLVVVGVLRRNTGHRPMVPHVECRGWGQVRTQEVLCLRLGLKGYLGQARRTSTFFVSLLGSLLLCIQAPATLLLVGPRLVVSQVPDAELPQRRFDFRRDVMLPPMRPETIHWTTSRLQNEAASRVVMDILRHIVNAVSVRHPNFRGFAQAIAEGHLGARERPSGEAACRPRPARRSQGTVAPRVPIEPSPARVPTVHG
mmetsp:Transcript_31519/g.86797  ORF Transcript_31519/g.86797 Transcript_31519/m.86797 type:complete len:289 (-) Transcript_31519:223-1089(-)